MTEIEKKEKIRRNVKLIPPLLIIFVIVVELILILDSLIDGNLNPGNVFALVSAFLMILLGYSSYKRHLQFLQT